MTRTTNSIFLFDDIWAADGDTTSAPFDPRTGWDITYSQAGGNTVSRTLVNGEFNKFAGLGYDVNRYGSNLFWDSTITYEIGATVLGSNNLRYIAVTQNSNNDPTIDGGTNWTPLKITFANDANVTISEDAATNTVTIGLVSNLSDKANSDLSNVTIGDFAAKIADGQYTYKQIDGSQVKINAYEILTDSNVTFSSDTLNKQMTFGTSISLSSLRNNFNGGTAPSPAVSGMLWSDTSTTTLYIRNSANDDWVTVANNDSYINSIFTGTYNINSNYNGRTYILINTGSGGNAPFTLNLPAHSSVQGDFRMDFISYGNSDITINAFSGEQIYRNQQLTSSVLLTNQENAIFSIIKFNNDDNFYLIGAEKSLDDNLSNITDAGKKVILDLLIPVGGKWSTFTNNTPPLNGILGVSWELISSGYALVTATPSTGGIAAGAKYLNSSLGTPATTETHTLTTSQIPGHTHPLSSLPIWRVGGGKLGPYKDKTDSNTLSGSGYQGTQTEVTASTGGSAPHDHALEVRTFSEVVYKRLS
jgi:hypothetical protein